MDAGVGRPATARPRERLDQRAVRLGLGAGVSPLPSAAGFRPGPTALIERVVLAGQNVEKPDDCLRRAFRPLVRVEAAARRDILRMNTPEERMLPVAILA